MKKIMFNDHYGLTKAVLEGRKTQTRRILNCPKKFGGKFVSGFRICTNSQGLQYAYLVDEDECEIECSVNILSAYKVGEEVAVAQSYHDAKKEVGGLKNLIEGHPLPSAKGINNKMFVKADLMPHHIKITNVRVERLQDISDEDCLKEGIIEELFGTTPAYWVLDVCFSNIRHAFRNLIDKTCGKGTWSRNPWVLVYEFELVK